MQSRALVVDTLRRAYLDALRPSLTELGTALFGDAPIDVDYHAGWRDDHTLSEALAAGLTRDREAGHTQHGPHRADLRISLRGYRARAHASRGEQKLVSAALLLAQARLLQQRRGHLPVLLIDDLVAELDARSREAVFRAVAGLGAQCFLSFLEPPQLPEAGGETRMFHVEQGRVSPLLI
jgi:DNA replication and repair protein RecF